MSGIEVLAGVTGLLAMLGVTELAVHQRRLKRIGTRIHVNGTRGKSSVTRLIAAGLRAGGIRTCAKTTGALARLILPDESELPIHRPMGANIIEQKRIVAAAASCHAEALVIECMALRPALQALCELRLVRATHGVITNVRPDHLAVMGPTTAAVARALAGTTPVGGKLFTREREQLEILAHAAADRGSQLVEVAPLDDHDALAGFGHTEHADNVALALAVCADLGVERDVALEGMWSAPADPGAMTEARIDSGGRRIIFVNGFAANDPVSSEQIYMLALQRHPAVTQRIMVFNCRDDRPTRSVQLGRALVGWTAADRVVLMGTGTSLFAQAAIEAGFDESKLVSAAGLAAEQVFERIVGLVGESALVMGMGNTGGEGLKLAAHATSYTTHTIVEGQR